MLLSASGLIGVPDDADRLDPEVLQTRAIFDAARAGLLASVSGARERIDLAEAQRLLDALTVARTLEADAEDRVLVQRSRLTAAEAKRRARARRAGFAELESRAIQLRPARPAASPAAARGAASVLVRALLPAAAAALAGAAIARRARQP